MRYAQIRETDISDGPGIRVAIYTQGCYHKCKGCYNKETWDFNGGYEWTKEINKTIIKLMDKPFIQGLSLLGGDPICTYLQDEENNYLMVELLREVKSTYQNKDIWLWTGYTIDELIKNPLQTKINPILSYIDVLVDGPYIEKEHDLKLPYAGSRNQRVIDVQKSLKMKQPVLL